MVKIPVGIENNSMLKELSVDMIVGTVCNYKCSYCFPGCNDGKFRWPDESQTETLKNNLDHLFEIYKKQGKERIVFNFIGGEPTLWPELGEFVKHIRNKFNVRAILTTNGSRTMRFWKEYAEFFHCVNFSVHNEECDVDHLINVLDWIYLNTKVPITSTLLMDTKNWDRCMDIVNKMSNHPIPWLFRVKPIRKNDVLIDYNNLQSQFLKKENKKMPPNDYIKEMIDEGRIFKKEVYTLFNDGSKEPFSNFDWWHNHWHGDVAGWKCNLGVDRFNIDEVGNIVGSCGARNLFNLTAPLNIYDKNFKENFSIKNINPLICQQQFCSCSPDLEIPKHR